MSDQEEIRETFSGDEIAEIFCAQKSCSDQGYRFSHLEAVAVKRSVEGDSVLCRYYYLQEGSWREEVCSPEQRKSSAFCGLSRECLQAVPSAAQAVDREADFIPATAGCRALVPGPIPAITDGYPKILTITHATYDEQLGRIGYVQAFARDSNGTLCEALYTRDKLIAFLKQGCHVFTGCLMKDYVWPFYGIKLDARFNTLQIDPLWFCYIPESIAVLLSGRKSEITPWQPAVSRITGQVKYAGQCNADCGSCVFYDYRESFTECRHRVFQQQAEQSAIAIQTSPAACEPTKENICSCNEVQRINYAARSKGVYLLSDYFFSLAMKCKEHGVFLETNSVHVTSLSELSRFGLINVHWRDRTDTDARSGWEVTVPNEIFSKCICNF